MKITEKALKNLILQELNDLVSTQNTPLQVQSDFEAGPLNNYANTIRQNIAQMHKIVNENEIDDRILRDFKKIILGDLYAGLSYLEGAVDASLKNNDEDI